jgi:hypothetical protein
LKTQPVSPAHGMVVPHSAGLAVEHVLVVAGRLELVMTCNIFFVGKKFDIIFWQKKIISETSMNILSHI